MPAPVRVECELVDAKPFILDACTDIEIFPNAVRFTWLATEGERARIIPFWRVRDVSSLLPAPLQKAPNS